MKGTKITSNKNLMQPKYECNGGYQVAREVSLDAVVDAKPYPYTILLSTFEAH
jgi:hypothetical protein